MVELRQEHRFPGLALMVAVGRDYGYSLDMDPPHIVTIRPSERDVPRTPAGPP